jgi:hypothetical protein
MVRSILSLLVLGFFAAGIVGCHAAATVDPHGASQMSLVK